MNGHKIFLDFRHGHGSSSFPRVMAILTLRTPTSISRTKIKFGEQKWDLANFILNLVNSGIFILWNFQGPIKNLSLYYFFNMTLISMIKKCYISEKWLSCHLNLNFKFDGNLYRIWEAYSEFDYYLNFASHRPRAIINDYNSLLIKVRKKSDNFNANYRGIN